VRLLYYIPGPTFGGAHNQVVRLADPLRAAGIEPVVLLPDQPGDAFERLGAAGVEVYRMELHRLRATTRLRTHWDLVATFRRQVAKLGEFLDRQRIDAVQVHGVTSLDGALAARSRDLPLIWQILDTRAPRALRLLTSPLIARYADAVLVTGTTVAAQYPGLAKLGDRVVPYYPPVNAGDFAPPTAAARAAARTVLGVAEDAVLVGDLGNLNPQKGHQFVVEAVGRVRQRHSADLRVRGGSATGHEAYARSVEDLATRHGMAGRIVGNLEPGLTPAGFLSALDVFVVGSEPRSEGVPTAIIEAMLTGLPVVASRVGGIEEVVREGQTGFCVRARDVDAMADRIVRLIADSDLRRTMGERARSLALAEFSLEACVEAHLRAYRAAAEQHRGRSPRAS
jgi:glycosyltransferase involved in cell wall biosynthesis